MNKFLAFIAFSVWAIVAALAISTIAGPPQLGSFRHLTVEEQTRNFLSHLTQ